VHPDVEDRFGGQREELERRTIAIRGLEHETVVAGDDAGVQVGRKRPSLSP
jgi:hypothetical protein